MPLITATGLVKEFRRVRRKEGPFAGVRTLFGRDHVTTRAVDGVDFDIAEGELVGYLGPNGAGKSTTIKMLTGILTPTAGDATVAGITPWRRRERNARNIGVVFGQRSQLWWDLPLIDSFTMIGRLYQVPEDRFAANLAKFTDVLELGSFLETPVRQLSLGQRMRGDLAAAMLYDPRILYLDEPTVGLDVLAKERIREFVAELNTEAGTTVLLTTHDMDDVERLCRRLILIDHGRVLYDGPVGRLKEKYAPERELVVHLAAGVTAPADVDVPGARCVEAADGRVRLAFDPRETPVAALIARVSAAYEITDLSVVEPDLEGVIRTMYAARGA